MARINKKSRLKGLPPRVLLGEQDTQPVYGNNSIPWNDTKTINFQEDQQDVNYGSKLEASSINLSSELSSSLSGPANIVAGVSDVWTILSGSSGLNAETIEPFRDSGNPASDGLSNQVEFFISGSKVSDVGLGFSQPLWSKTKIEIDISSNPCSFKLAISQSKSTDTSTGSIPGYVSGSSYPMAYYNFKTKIWEGIGTGLAYQTNNIVSGSMNVAFRDQMDYGTYGFNPGILNLKTQIVNQITSSTSSQAVTASHLLSLDPPRKDILAQRKAGHPTDSFGFPYAAKFHATSSQLLNMSDYIKQPFLLEKVVLEVSGAQFTMFDTVNTNGLYSLTSSLFPATVNTFFILNQKKNEKYSVLSNDENYFFQIPKLQELTANSQPVLIDTIRDLVTYGNITAYTNDLKDRPTEEIKYEPEPDLNFNLASPLFQFVAVQNGELLPSFSLTKSFNLQDQITRDYQIHISQSISSSVESLNWENNINVNLDVKSPNTTLFLLGNHPLRNSQNSGYRNNFSSFQYGGTNGLGFFNISSRRLRTDYRNGTLFTTGNEISIDSSLPLAITFNYSTVAQEIFYDLIDGDIPEYSSVNPYMLFPEDQLVFGWQLPLVQWLSDFFSLLASGENIRHFNAWQHLSLPPRNTVGTTGPDPELIDICQMAFNGPAKVVFYGSYVSNDQEDHNPSDSVVVSNRALTKVIS